MTDPETRSAKNFYATVMVEQEVIDRINHYLNDPLTYDDHLDEDDTISADVRFPDGRLMSMDCCGVEFQGSYDDEDGDDEENDENYDSNAYTQAVLFDADGRQLTYLEPSYDFEGEWPIDYEGQHYEANIVPTDETRRSEEQTALLSIANIEHDLLDAIESITKNPESKGMYLPVAVSFVNDMLMWWYRTEDGIVAHLIDRNREVIATSVPLPSLFETWTIEHDDKTYRVNAEVRKVK